MSEFPESIPDDCGDWSWVISQEDLSDQPGWSALIKAFDRFVEAFRQSDPSPVFSEETSEALQDGGLL